MSDALPLKPGDGAPAFRLKDQRGKTVKLSDFKGRPVLVYFYPKADTPGCTAQACGLRDITAEIGKAVVVGISPDQPEALDRFDQKYDLGFPLLSDPDHEVAEKYGVWGEKKMYGKTYLGVIRSAFLVGPKGKLVQVWPTISPADTPYKLQQALAEGALT